MKKCIFFIILLLCIIQGAFAQESEDPILMSFGPRLGVTFVVMGPSEFDATVKAIFPEEENTFFPVYSEIGFSCLQEIPLGGSTKTLIFQENFLLGGLDQNFAYPSLTLLMGYKGAGNFTLGVGPYFSFYDSADSRLEIQYSMTFMLGWFINGDNFNVPVSLQFTPYPSYGNPRFTLTTGIDFRVAD